MKELEHRKVLGVLIILAVLAVFSLAHVRGNFSDVATSEGNKVSSAEFDVRISKDGKRFYDSTKIFSIDDMKPGETKEFTFYVKNYGEIEISNVSLFLKVKDIEDEISPAEKPHDMTEDVGELSSCLVLRIYSNGTKVTEGRLSELAGKKISLFSGTLKSGEKFLVRLHLTFDKNAGNECMTDSVEVYIKIVAVQ
ncbi:TasA family protein [Pyrococcus sp. ST04]|uniref:TasA family protein n=1 Tax=Pyrococcus sp. ST04 TaxID=1183377 RepID=UPI0002605B56|nr:TasA family protein [Pyrococcus sp. ST04]AFK22253.1 methyltransferase [Pyrococcus sp. ST04]